MKASEIKLNRFLSENNTQFVIPVYQRNYDWKLAQCKQLLEDIFEVGTNKNSHGHFIGSIVYVHDDIYSASGVRELVVIDGQQRLTSITLIYLTVYLLADSLGDEKLKAQIGETYLINKFAPEEEKLKLRPTENNDKAYKYLLRAGEGEEYEGFSRLIENFDYFKSRITEENFKVVLDGLSKLMFVEISLERGKDDPQKIFESLNSTGLELSQADLIRNYILMGLDRRDQDIIYSKYWELIEQQAKEENSNSNRVSDFIRDYLTLENSKIPNKNKVYEEFKTKYPVTSIGQLEENLGKIKGLVYHYSKLLNPKKEPDPEIRKQLEYLDKMEINVAYPFLMKVYDDYAKGKIVKSEFLNVLETVQSYAWRRFILALPSNALNKIFMVLYQDVDYRDYVESIQRSLLRKKGTGRFPRDGELLDVLREKDLYNIKSRNRLYFFERLENHNNKETVDIEANGSITVEHIFPQNPDSSWRQIGEPDFTELKEKYLHTISNLTLSGNNGSLGNKSFLLKRDMNHDGGEQGYRFSRLWLNKYLSELEEWNKEQLLGRFEIIKERFLKVWPFPSIEFDEDIDFLETNIFQAEDPTGKKLSYAIFFDQKLKINNISTLYVKVIGDLFDLHAESFFTSDVGEKISLTKNPADLRQAIPINDTYFIEGNLDSRNKVQRIKAALTLFNSEDDLYIKYKE